MLIFSNTTDFKPKAPCLEGITHALERYARTIAHMTRSVNTHTHASFKHHSFEELLLTHARPMGLAYKRTEHSMDFLFNITNECFRNCFLEAEDRADLVYCEGLACSTTRLPFPVYHAWLMDEAGRVYDPTWEVHSWFEPGPESYFGIAFDLGFVRKQAMVDECWGVFGEGRKLATLCRTGLPAKALHAWHEKAPRP